jgi:alkanesulfonate monooxygenase SsuD/methylene tetrahydromethanopterin reductase-like flavin-dependent oxidoreductase (luciferase family)
MRTGLFCTYDNPQQNFARAFIDQQRLVQAAEALGFDDAWIAEHHFNMQATSPAPFALLAHLAACTSHIRLGSAAILLPFHDPIMVAENVATLDLLSGGRFDFGVAKGGPFPVQNKHFRIDKETSRERMLEALVLINRLLYENEVTFDGWYYSADGVSLAPKPVQQPIPTYLATSSEELLPFAVKKGYGLMAGPPFPIEAVARLLTLFNRLAPEANPRLILLRFYHVAPTHEQAMSEACAFLQPFVMRMQQSTAIMQPEWTSWFEVDRIINDSLIGTPAGISEKLAHIDAVLRPHSLVLKPLRPRFEERRDDLALFQKDILTAARIPAQQPAMAG